MASDKDVSLSIGVDDAGLQAGMRAVQETLKSASEQMQNSMKGVVGSFNTARSALVGFTAIVAGGGVFRQVINASVEWTGEVGKLAKALGISTEQASVMNVALKHLGLDSELVVSASEKMSKQIFSNAEAFATLGVKVRDSAGQYRPVTEIMADVNAKLVAIKNPIEQNIAGQQVYGESWNEVRGILRLTADQMTESEKRARELGLIVGPEGEANAKMYKTQLRDLNLVATSLEVQFGNALLPVFTRLGKYMSEEGPIAGKTFGLVIESIGFAASATWLALKDMGQGIGAMAAQAAALLHGDLDAFRFIGAERDKQAKENEAAYERLKKGFGAPPPPPAGAGNGGKSNSPTYNFKPDKDKADRAKEDKSRMSEWEAELASQKAAYEQQSAQDGTFQQYTLTQELAFWEKKQALAKTGTAEVAATQKKVGELRLQILRKDHEAELQIDAINTEQAKNAALARVDADEQAGQLEVALGRKKAEELLNDELAFEDRRNAIRLQALQEKSLMAEKDPERNKVEVAKIHAEIEQLEISHQAKLSDIRGKIAVANANPFNSFLKTAEGGFSQFANSMLMRTQTLAQGLAQLYKQMAGSFISEFIVKKSMALVADQAKEIALKSTTLTSLFGLEAAGAAKTVGIKATEATAVVSANAAEGASGAAASVASIPFVGWAMAAGVFASTMAMIMGAQSSIPSASGGFDIPAGINPITQLHAEEMVLPKGPSNTVRSLRDLPEMSARV